MGLHHWYNLQNVLFCLYHYAHLWKKLNISQRRISQILFKIMKFPNLSIMEHRSRLKENLKYIFPQLIKIYLFIYFFKFLTLYFAVFFFFLLYNIVLVLPYINMNPPRVYTCSPSWTLLPPPSPYHPSGSSQCTSPKHPVSCINANS